jgi:hypothetical protein
MMVDSVKAGVVSPHFPMNASKKQLLQTVNS